MVYRLEFQKDRVYTIELVRLGGTFDPYLRLETSKYRTLHVDDDGAGNLNSRITFVCQQSGVYRIVATSLSGGFGRFLLRVREE